MRSSTEMRLKRVLLFEQEVLICEKDPSNLTCVSSRFEKRSQNQSMIKSHRSQYGRNVWNKVENWNITEKAFPYQSFLSVITWPVKQPLTIIKGERWTWQQFLCCFWDVCRGELIRQDLFYSAWIVWNVPLNFDLLLLTRPSSECVP